MALRTLTGCASSSTTAGTGTYTISATAPPSRRSLVDAVNAGAASNGDTIYACIADFTTSGPTFQFEYGLYTIGSGGLTLARTTVIESSNSNNEVDWDSGGTRDVVFSTGNWLVAANNLSDIASAATARTNLAVPGLAAQNTYTLSQDGNTIQNVSNLNGGTSANAAWQTQSDTAVASFVSHGSGRTFVRFGAALGGRSEVIGAAGGLNIGTIGASSLVFGTAGAKVAEITAAGVFQNASGTPYENFPSGFVMLAESVPTGWARGDIAGGRLIKLASSGDTLGAQAGSDNIFDGAWDTEGHNLTIAEMAAHDHGILANTSAGSTLRITAALGDGAATIDSNSEGGGLAHSHTMTLPNYRIMGRIVKS